MHHHPPTPPAGDPDRDNARPAAPTEIAEEGTKPTQIEINPPNANPPGTPAPPAHGPDGKPPANRP